MLALLLFLQVGSYETAFERSLREAEVRLGLRPSKVVESTVERFPAWVPRMPTGFNGGIVFVRPDFLQVAHPDIQRIVGYHETCHNYLGWPSPYREEVMHLAIDGCVEWLLGPSYDHVMSTIPCGRWYPHEALRYQRRTGRRRCVETR